MRTAVFTIVLALVLANAPAAARPAEAALPLEQLRLFVEVMERIKRDYVEDVDDETLIRAAIRGMLAGLDPHSAYLDEEAWDDIQATTVGRYDGLGLEVSMDRGLLRVVAPIDGGPAARAGMRTGDVIMRIDDRPVQVMDPDDAVRALRGPAGTGVRLLLMREGVELPFTLELTRERIELVSVKGELYDGVFAYLRLSIFRESTGAELEREFSRLRGQADDGAIEGLVLDLRSNPGGVLDAAVDVADMFLEDGLIVRAEGRNPAARYQREATPGDLAGGKPIVVLVDGGSASASEIVAGALQDHRRAIVMGEPTFGKGSVQAVIPLPPAQGIKLTTARYYTPSGRSIQADGVIPDVAVAPLHVAAEPRGPRPLREADLERHLRNDDKGSRREGAAPTGAAPTLAERDFALSEALNLLRGLRIMQAHGRG